MSTKDTAKVIQIATIGYGATNGPYDTWTEVKVVALRDDGRIFVRDINKVETSWLELDAPVIGKNVSDYHTSVPDGVRVYESTEND